MRKTTSFIFVLILFSTLCHAQDPFAYKYKNVDSTKANRLDDAAIVLHLGIAASTIEWGLKYPLSTIINTSFVPSRVTQFISVSPVYSATADYGIGLGAAVGYGLAWQSVNTNTGKYAYVGNKRYPITERFTRTNQGWRLLYHTGVSTVFDFYNGLRLGESFWTDNTTPAAAIPDSKQNEIDISIQYLFGCNIFFSDIFGIHIEAALGTPYFIEAGLNIRMVPDKRMKQ